MKNAMKQKRIENPDLLKEIALQPCVHSFKGPCDPCHITSVGSGGDDTRDNVIPLLNELHCEAHEKGWAHMARKYWQIRLWLLRMGRWDILSKISQYKDSTGLTMKEKKQSEFIWKRLERFQKQGGINA